MKTIRNIAKNAAPPIDSGDANCRELRHALMLVVFPPSMRHDECIVPSYYEDHLLERVSLLELHLAQMGEHIKSAYEFLRHETEKFKKDHEFLQVFFETIEKMNPRLAEEISKNFLELRDEKKARIRY